MTEQFVNRSSRPYRDDPVTAARVANIRYRLGEERQAREAAARIARHEPIPNLDRRIEAIEAAIFQLHRVVEELAS